jgi:hypothetical protein
MVDLPSLNNLPDIVDKVVKEIQIPKANKHPILDSATGLVVAGLQNLANQKLANTAVDKTAKIIGDQVKAELKQQVKQNLFNSVAGPFVSQALTYGGFEVAKRVPKFAAAVMQKLPSNCYSKGILEGRAEMLNAMTSVVQSASLLEFCGMMGELIKLNPSANAVSKLVLVGGLGYATYRGTTYLLSEITLRQLRSQSMRYAKENLLSLFRTGKLNDEKYKHLLSVFNKLKSLAEYDNFIIELQVLDRN